MSNYNQSLLNFARKKGVMKIGAVSKLMQLLEQHPTIVVTIPGCPHCVTAMKTLTKHNVTFKEIKGEDNIDLVNEIKLKQKHKTFPMIYLKGNFIGGNDKLQDYYRKIESDKENIL